MYLSNHLQKEIKKITDEGGVITFVTDTVWGLGCLPENKSAVEKIYEIKHRETQKPLILMSNSIENLKPFVHDIDETAQNYIDKYFPGALTLVVPKSSKTANYITSDLDTVGIRVPANEVFSEICECVTGHVLATTSANLSHQPSAKSYKQAVLNMKDKADMILPDFNQLCQGLESTVLQIKNNEIKILRQGAIKLNL